MKNFFNNYSKKNKQSTKTVKAFTLIELLIVIAVIGILVAVILPNLIGMRARARDTKKKNDLVQVKNALRMYYNDYNTYPNASGTRICCTTPEVTCSSVCAGALTVAGQTYTKDLPEDFKYYQTNGGEGFLLTVELENASDQDIAASKARCPTVIGGGGLESLAIFRVCED
jgi:type IV pilus assembly protein PilA